MAGYDFEKLGTFLQKMKPFLAIISLQFGYAGMYIITTVCLKKGMNHYVLSVYRHVFATLAIGPFALIFERKTRPKLTLGIFLRIMVLGFIEPVIDQNMYYVGLKATTATFASASINVLPAITFILATIFRLEKVDIRKIPSQAKIAGTVVTVAGAMVMTLYKGPVVDLFFSASRSPGSTSASSSSSSSSEHHWIFGTLMLLGSCVGWAGFFIIQSFTLKMYPAELSLTALICVMGALEGAVVTVVMERDMSVWALGWDSRLLASVYTGVVCSGIAYYVQGVVNRERGPVFVTAFSPLCMIITAALGGIILAEQIHLGSIIGAVIIIVGLYTVVWGKTKDQKSTKKTTTTTTSSSSSSMELSLPNSTTGKGKILELPVTDHGTEVAAGGRSSSSQFTLGGNNNNVGSLISEIEP